MAWSFSKQNSCCWEYLVYTSGCMCQVPTSQSLDRMAPHNFVTFYAAHPSIFYSIISSPWTPWKCHYGTLLRNKDLRPSFVWVNKPGNAWIFSSTFPDGSKRLWAFLLLYPQDGWRLVFHDEIMLNWCVVEMLDRIEHGVAKEMKTPFWNEWSAIQRIDAAT